MNKIPKDKRIISGSFATGIIALIIAIGQPWYQHWVNSPELKIISPPYKIKFIRKSHEFGKDVYLLNIELGIHNSGRSVARNCQVIVKSVWEWNEIEGKFSPSSIHKMNPKSKKLERLEFDWVPTNLPRILYEDYYVLVKSGKKIQRWRDLEEIGRINYRGSKNDLVPSAINIYQFGIVHEDKSNFLSLAHLAVPTGDMEVDFPKGKYCFEISAFSDNTEEVSKYLYVDWKGLSKKDIHEWKTKMISDKIIVELTSIHPTKNKKNNQCDLSF
jgi:hypothetical protein